MTMADYFIDSNIFIYSVGRDHLLKPACVSIIKKIRNEKIRASISTEIIQEILYRYQSIKELRLGIRLVREAMVIAFQILPVTEKEVSLAMEIMESHPQIETRDAFHAATMINNGIKEIISTDPHFDIIPQITRIDPQRLK